MRGLIAIALLLITAQAAADEQVISVQHDSQRGVTCWILNNTGISCLPDSQFTAHTSSTTTESQATRASMAIPMCQTDQLPTTSHSHEERFQL